MLKQLKTAATTTFGCPQCPYETQWSFQLDHHIRRQHETIYQAELFHAIFEPGPHCCNKCKFKSFYQLDLYEHCVRVHKLKLKGDETVHEDDGYCEEFGCFSGCKFKAFSILPAAKHYEFCEMVGRATGVKGEDAFGSQPIKSERNHNDCAAMPSITYHCAMCFFTTKYKGSLKRHIMLQHANPEDVVWYNCENCSFKTKHKRCLKVHSLEHVRHDDIEWHNCDKCFFRAKQKSNLKQHMITHALGEEVDWYKCNKCSFRTKHKTSLRNHTLTHANPEDIEWQKCDKCSYQTKKRRYLKQHMLTHATSGEIDWYKCNNCSFKTKRKPDLRRHILQHANPKEIEWHKCDKCSYKTYRKDNVKIHMSRIHVSPTESVAKKVIKQNKVIEKKT